MSTRLRPIVQRRGFAVGSAPLRIGNLFYVALFTLAFAGFSVGTIAMADVVRSAMRSS